MAYIYLCHIMSEFLCDGNELQTHICARVRTLQARQTCNIRSQRGAKHCIGMAIANRRSSPKKCDRRPKSRFEMRCKHVISIQSLAESNPMDCTKKVKLTAASRAAKGLIMAPMRNNAHGELHFVRTFSVGNIMIFGHFRATSDGC